MIESLITQGESSFGMRQRENPTMTYAMSWLGPRKAQRNQILSQTFVTYLFSYQRDSGCWKRGNFCRVRKRITQLPLELVILRSRPNRVAPNHSTLKFNENLVELYHRD